MKDNFKFIKINKKAKEWDINLSSKDNDFKKLLNDINKNINNKGNVVLIFKDENEILYSLVKDSLINRNYEIKKLKADEKDNIYCIKNIFKDGRLAIFFECDDINNVCNDMLDIYYTIDFPHKLSKDIIFYMDSSNIPGVGFRNERVYEIIFANDIQVNEIENLNKL